MEHERVYMHFETAIRHIQRAIPSLIALYSFGSQSRGAARPDSDVDLAVLASTPIQELRRFALAQDIAMQLHRNVDLVDLRCASTVMRMQVLSTGVCLYAPDEPARQEFEMYTYADYARLNEERREVLKGIAHRGLVYG
jgi:predicted nucleotidyltransferase